LRLKSMPMSVLCVGLLVVSGALAQGGGAEGTETPASVVFVDPVRTVGNEDVVPGIGRLVARQAGPIASRVAGAVDAFHVEVGDRVAAGDPIATIDAAILRGNRDLVARRRAQAVAAVVVRQQEYHLAREERERFERLRETAATSAALYQNARRREAVEKARVTQAEAALVTVNSELELAELRLRYASIIAPYPGVVVSRETEVGAYLQVGQAVARLVSDSALEVEVGVPYRHLAGLQPGGELEVTVDGGARERATLRAILPEQNVRTRTRVVRLVPGFDVTARAAVPGQNVTVWVPAGERRERLTVHKDAVIKRGARDLVYLVVDGVAVLRPVTLGVPVGERIEVLDGLAEGDLAVVRGNERLRPDDAVRIAGAP